MNKKEIRNFLRAKGDYNKTDLDNYSSLSAGKISTALLNKSEQYCMPLFNLIEDKDTSVGSEIDKRFAGVENKLFTHCLDKKYDASVEQLIKAAIHAKLFGVSVVELYLNKDGEFCFELIPKEFYNFEKNTIYLKKGKSKIKLSQPKYYILKHKPVLLKTLWITYAKHFVLTHYLKFTEFLGVPPLIGNASSSDVDTIDGMEEAFKNLKSGSFAILGPQDLVKVLEGRGTQGDFLEFVRYADNEIAKIINGASLISNASQKASYALGKVHDNNRYEIIKADIKYAKTIANTLFRTIGEDLNLNIAFKKDKDLLKRAQTLSIIKNLGYEIDLEDIKDEFDLKSLTPSKTEPKEALNIRSLNSKALKSYDEIDRTLESKEFEKSLQIQEEEILNAIENISKDATSYEDLYKKLCDSFEDISLDKLETYMSKAIVEHKLKGLNDE